MIHHGAARAEAAARHPRCLTAPPSPEQYAPRRPEGVQTYILRRLLARAPTLFFASLIVFVTVRLIPGNVIDLVLSQNDKVQVCSCSPDHMDLLPLVTGYLEKVGVKLEIQPMEYGAF